MPGSPKTARPRRLPPATPRNLSVHQPLPDDCDLVTSTTIPVINPNTEEEVSVGMSWQLSVQISCLSTMWYSFHLYALSVVTGCCNIERDIRTMIVEMIINTAMFFHKGTKSDRLRIIMLYRINYIILYSNIFPTQICFNKPFFQPLSV